MILNVSFRPLGKSSAFFPTIWVTRWKTKNAITDEPNLGLSHFRIAVFEFFKQTLVRKIHWLRHRPIRAQNIVDLFHKMFFRGFDSQLAAAVETARRQVDGADDGSGFSSEKSSLP